jgi:hypothetical protein
MISAAPLTLYLAPESLPLALKKLDAAAGERGGGGNFSGGNS